MTVVNPNGEESCNRWPTEKEKRLSKTDIMIIALLVFPSLALLVWWFK